MKWKVYTVMMLVLPTFASSCLNGQSTHTIEKSSKAHPIVDMHMHVFQWNKYGEPPEPNPITGRTPAARSDMEALENYILQMERYNIVLAVGSGESSMVEKMKLLAKNRFLGGTEFPRFTTPVYKRVEEWPDPLELRRMYESEQFNIMGEISGQYAGAAPNDPRLDPYYALAEALDVPVCLHTGFGPTMSPYRGDLEFRMRHGNPLLLEDVLVKYPNLRIYIAHGGYPFLTETIALMLMYEQVYADISAINWLLPREEFHYYLKSLVRARLGKRIMFGSDQMIWPDSVGLSIEAVRSAQFLSESQKHDIFFNNAAKFLRLDASQYLRR
jgi:hypothetical protein